SPISVTATTVRSLTTTPVAPSPAAEGVLFTFQVSVNDSVGNPLPQAGIPVTVALASQPAGVYAVLGGTTTVLTHAGGIAAFGFMIDQSGTFSIVASSPGTSSSLIGPFVVTPQTARSLAFAASPAGPIPVNTAFGTTVQLCNALGTNAAVANVPVTL